MTEALTLAVVLAVVAVAARCWRARDGRVRTVADRFSEAELTALAAPGSHRLLVEFTAPSCPPCATTRRLLDDLADEHHDVVVRAVDVGESLQLVRRHGVLRAPTTFVLDDAGHVLGRVAGVPERDDLARLLDTADDMSPTRHVA